MTSPFWNGRRVFVTGHTGFKGGWLTLGLAAAGAKVYGYSLKPPTEPNLFGAARLESCLSGHVLGDVRDGESLRREMKRASPSVVLHLAAQPRRLPLHLRDTRGVANRHRQGEWNRL